MPLDLIESEEEKNKNKPQAGKAAGGALIDSSKQAPAAGEAAYSGAEKGGASAPATPASQAQQTPAPIRGSGFTGVGRFLKANVGSGLGQQIAGRISQTGQQAGQRLKEATEQFRTGISRASSEYGTQESAARSALERIKAGGAAPTQEEVAQYMAASSGQYKGPSELQDMDAVRSQSQLAQTLAGQTQTAKGRTSLLQQLVGRGAQPYTKGQSALDALVLGQSGAALAQSRGAAAGLERKVESEENLAKEQARQKSQEILSKARELSQEKSGAEKATLSEIQAQQQAYETGLSYLSNKIKSDILGGSLSKETVDALKKVGLDPSSKFYGLPVDQIATLVARKEDPSTLASSAKLEQLQKMNALKQLSAQVPQFSAEELQKAGTTIDPVSGLKTTKNIPEFLAERKGAYKKRVESLVPSAEAAAELAERTRTPYRNSMIKIIDKDIQRELTGSGSLFNEETGELNLPLAKKLEELLNARQNIQARYEGDPERLKTIKELIAGASSPFKIESE